MGGIRICRPFEPSPQSNLEDKIRAAGERDVTVGINAAATKIQLELDLHHKLQLEELGEDSIG